MDRRADEREGVLEQHRLHLAGRELGPEDVP
jgi:hypothetical protein